MPRIPFLLVRTFDPQETFAALEERFLRHLGNLRGVDPFADDNARDPTEPETVTTPKISTSDRHPIRWRIKRILEERNAISGLGRQKAEDRDRLEKLHGGVRLVSIASEARADEIAAQLHDEFPWLGPASESVWWSLRRSVRDGLPGVRLEPLLLDGPPGIGKSAWARHLAKLLDTRVTEIDATNENASFGIVGAQRGWGNSAPGRVLSDMMQHRLGNPVVVIDEIEKAGRPVSMKGSVYDLPSALLPLLEPSTARRWTCPYHELPFDMRWIGWVLTSNCAALLPEPVLSRCPPLRLRSPTITELAAFVQREGARRALSAPAIEALVEVLERLRRRNDPPALSMSEQSRLIAMESRDISRENSTRPSPHSLRQRLAPTHPTSRSGLATAARWSDTAACPTHPSEAIINALERGNQTRSSDGLAEAEPCRPYRKQPDGDVMNERKLSDRSSMAEHPTVFAGSSPDRGLGISAGGLPLLDQPCREGSRQS